MRQAFLDKKYTLIDSELLNIVVLLIDIYSTYVFGTQKYIYTKYDFSYDHIWGNSTPNQKIWPLFIY